MVVLALDRALGKVAEGVDPGFAAELHGSEQVLEADDVAVEVGDVGVVDGQGDVI